MRLFIAFVLLSFVGIPLEKASADQGQGSPYFPRLGSRAFAEEIRELKNPTSILFVAMTPGSEDMASIAYCRVGLGTKVAVAFVTNGEDIPSDLNGETFYRLAARRKEEAYRALSYLGVQAYFLNAPVNLLPAGAPQFKLTRVQQELIGIKLDTVIARFQPDVIVLGRDPLYGGRLSPRLRYLKNIVLSDVRDARKRRGWNVARVVEETSGARNAVTMPVDRKDRLWSRSYANMASRAYRFYSSLKFHIPIWNEGRTHKYAMIYPSRQRTPLPLSEGLPKIGNELNGVYPYIVPVFSLDTVTSLKTRLDVLTGAITRTDDFIQAHKNGMSAPVMKVVTHWITGLEKLRATALDVDVHYSTSYKVVAQLQLFFLRFGKIQSRVGNSNLRILFPGVLRSHWVVNEKNSEFYPLHANDTFRVITPRLKLDSPESPEGFMAMEMRRPFRFIILHHDKDPAGDFIYRAEIPLIFAPVRSIQVTTPQVAALRDRIVRVLLTNNTRDSASGIMYIKDPLVYSDTVKVDLRGKGFVQNVSLRLHWKDTVLAGVRRVELLAGKNEPVGTFYAHYMQVKAEPRGKVAIYSLMDQSPLGLALARLGVNAVDLRSALSRSQETLSDYSTVIVDQFAYESFLNQAGKMGDLEKWVKSGGTLILLPQFSMHVKGMGMNSGCGFAYLPVTGAGAELKLDSEATVFRSPNEVSGSDLAEGQFPVSFGVLTGLQPGDSKMLIETEEHTPLLAEQQVGQGRIFYCALNLFPRIDAIYPSTYRLLANMISQ